MSGLRMRGTQMLQKETSGSLKLALLAAMLGSSRKNSFVARFSG